MFIKKWCSWGGIYERRNACCVNICQGHFREKCWKNVIFHTYISGGEGKRKMSKVGDIIAKERGRCSVGDCLLFVGKAVEAGNAGTIAFCISIVVYIGSNFRS